jgi:hypothetical protein
MTMVAGVGDSAQARTLAAVQPSTVAHRSGSSKPRYPGFIIPLL